MLHYARAFAVGTLILGLGGCVSTAPQGGNGQSEGPPVTVQHRDALVGKSRVAIGGFKVTFVTFDKSTASSRSPMWSSSSGYAKSTLRAKLVGVSDATFQSITDTAYASFRDTLTANGYDVVARRIIEAHPAYANIDLEPSPQKTESSMKALTGGSREDATFAPSTLPLVPSRGRLWPHELATIAKEEQVPVVNAHYVVHFAYFGKETGFDANTWNELEGAGHDAKVTAGQGVQVLPGSRVDLIAGYEGTFEHPNAYLELAHPVNDFRAYGSTRDATTGGQKLANTFSAVVGVFSGGAQSAKEIAIDADEARYATAVGGVLDDANALLVEEMAAGR